MRLLLVIVIVARLVIGWVVGRVAVVAIAAVVVGRRIWVGLGRAEDKQKGDGDEGTDEKMHREFANHGGRMDGFRSKMMCFLAEQ